MGGSIGEDGEAQPCILELALASREKNGLHLVACFSWKKEGDELRRHRERHKDRAFGHAFGVRVVVAAGCACAGTGLTPTATWPAHERGHPRFQSRGTAMVRPMQHVVPVKRLDGRVNGVAYTVRRPNIDGWSRVGSMVKKKRTPAHYRAQRRALVRRLLGRQQQQGR
jgi:hypothetical protein